MGGRYLPFIRRLIVRIHKEFLQPNNIQQLFTWAKDVNKHSPKKTLNQPINKCKKIIHEEATEAMKYHPREGSK